MRETSGRYCLGRDLSADFTSASSAEAGLFQTSWGARTKHAELPKLYERYKTSQHSCLLDVFSKGISCSTKDAINWGQDGEEGKNWQNLTKSCPGFATEYAAVLIRVHGGKNGEFGPLRKHKAEIRPECDAMLSKVQKLVKEHPDICDALK
jgi:hypothetical protein